MGMISKRTLGIFFFLAFLSQFVSAASDDAVEQSLKNLYEGKILFLREPLEKDFLRYDGDGKPLTKGQSGAWTVYGAIRIDKLELKLKPNQLRLRGKRVSFVFDDQKKKLIPYEFKLDKGRKKRVALPSVNVEIDLIKQPDSIDSAQAALATVFALNKDDFIKSVPEFWREYLTKHFGYDPGSSYEMEFTSEVTRDPASARKLSANVRDRCCGEGVNQPKSISTPEPEFSEEARRERFQGVVGITVTVNKEGRTEQIRIVKPLGFGLDEKAAEVVSLWTFKPAMRNGEPVAVQMGVDVNFHLYSGRPR